MPRHEILSHPRIEARISSIFSCIEHAKKSLDFLNSEALPLWQELASKTEGGRHRYTAYTRGFARGIFDTHWHRIMREKVEFVYKPAVDVPQIGAKAGELFSTHKVSVHRRTEEFYVAGLGIMLNEAYYTHVWLGTDKPISAWAAPRKSNLPQNGTCLE